ncbi:PBECR2 nuclease fold domain-containing protein [Brevibacillus nitrificans]|uniref:PBECR3 domain-containing polyvalent protein n=1 Tax=Brevibacillus nitrificans TaxID=651560 RepID=UPI000A521121|nr:PBECR2 nuclease fold domain-containing protein [Brevibacillus nitrificans]MDR7319636.1 hypothetical protein [Brevibacillus nitrificans]
MSLYTVNPDATQRQIVGMLDIAKINHILGKIVFPESGIPREIWMYPGLKKHVQKRHPGIFEAYHQYVPDIVENPDYVGQNPKEPGIELYKKINDTILLSINLDPDGYFYVSSFYDLKNAEAKIEKRLQSGRIKPYL